MNEQINSVTSTPAFDGTEAAKANAIREAAKKEREAEVFTQDGVDSPDSAPVVVKH